MTMRDTGIGGHRSAGAIKLIGAGLVAATLAVASLPAQAVYGVSDAKVLMEIIRQTKLLDDKFGVTEQLQQELNRLTAELGVAEIDNDNNRSANEIARITQAAADIYNMELARDLQAAYNACDAVSTSEAIAAAACQREDLVRSDAKAYVQRGAEVSSKGRSAAIREQVNEAVSAQRQIDQEAGQGEESLYLRADVLLSPAGNQYTPLEERASEQFVDLVVGPIHEGMNAGEGSLEEDGTEATKARALGVRSFVARKALARNSLMTIRSLYQGGDGAPSTMGTLQKFVDEHFGSKQSVDFQKVITATHENKGDCDMQTGKASDGSDCKIASEAAVVRAMAIMDAFSIYLQFEQYKQSLRMESLQSAQLAVALEGGK